jgi:hypothetical protein
MTTLLAKANNIPQRHQLLENLPRLGMLAASSLNKQGKY